MTPHQLCRQCPEGSTYELPVVTQLVESLNEKVLNSANLPNGDDGNATLLSNKSELPEAMSMAVQL